MQKNPKIQMENKPKKQIKIKHEKSNNKITKNNRLMVIMKNTKKEINQ